MHNKGENHSSTLLIKMIALGVTITAIVFASTPGHNNIRIGSDKPTELNIPPIVSACKGDSTKTVNINIYLGDKNINTEEVKERINTILHEKLNNNSNKTVKSINSSEDIFVIKGKQLSNMNNLKTDSWNRQFSVTKCSIF